MNIYLISYDLMTPGKDYSRLHAHLKSYNGWAKPLESVWLIKSSLEISELRDQIHAFMDYNDKVLVIDITGKAAAWLNLPKDVSDWIKNAYMIPTL